MPPRCPNGSRRDKITKKCVKKTTKKAAKKTVKKRCPKGSRRNKITGECDKNGSVIPTVPAVRPIVPPIVIPQPIPQPLPAPRQSIWCNLNQVDIRRTIHKMGLSRDITINDIPTHENPNKLCDSFKDIIGTCLKGWRITSKLGEGAFGIIYGVIRKSDNLEGVMKIQHMDPKEIELEINSQRHFHKFKLAPKIIETCIFKPDKMPKKIQDLLKKSLDLNKKEMKEKIPQNHKVYLIFMGKVDGVVEDFVSRVPETKKGIEPIVNAIVDVVKKLKKANISHGDFHFGNMGFKYIDSSKKFIKMVPIDFGWANITKSSTKIELLKPAETIGPEYFDDNDPKKPSKDFVKIFRELLQEKSESVFKIKIPKTDKALSKAYESEHKKYEKDFHKAIKA